MTNETPTIHSEGLTIDRLNHLLDQLTSKRFVSAALAAQTIRAALDLHGITLPILEVEGGEGGRVGSSVADSPFILHGVQQATNPTMYAPPVEGEWFFKIKDADGPDDDLDDHLNLYIVMNLDEQNLIECYAQVLHDDEVEDVVNMDDITDKDYEELVGDVAGETKWLKKQRHIGTFKADK